MDMRFAFVFLAACWSHPPADAPVVEHQTQTPSILAAGVYWVPYSTYDADAPKALVAYVTPSEATAKKIVKALDDKLPFGFPYVIYTDEINAETPRGIAVVTAAYATTDVMPGVRIAGVTPRVLALGTDPYPTAENPRHVTVIDRGAPVRAWSKRAVESAEQDADAAELPTEDARKRFVHEHLGVPACTVKPGDLFVVEESELKYYEFAPVRCNGQLAYVPWTSSLLGHAVIVPEPRGGWRLYQVVGAECDSPIIESWAYGPNGRKPALETDEAGCRG
jgi:hypothetical protein